MRRFFIIILLLVSGLAAPGETIVLESGISCDITPRLDADFPLIDYLQLCDRTITRVFGIGKGAPLRDLKIVPDAGMAADRFTLEDGDAGIVMTVSKNFAAWRNDRALRRELLNAMLLCRHTFNPAWPDLRAPGWMLAGLDAEVQARLRPEWLYRVGYYPAVRGSLLSGRRPDWPRRFIADPDMRDASDTVDAVYMESSRLMLEMGWRMPPGGGNPLSDYLILWLERPDEHGRIFMATIGRAALARSGASAASADLDGAARQLENWVFARIFSGFQPLPGHEVLERLQALSRVSIEVTDSNQQTVTVSGDWSEMADWSRHYPEVASLALTRSRELANLRARSGLVLLPAFDAADRLLKSMAQGRSVNADEWRRALAAFEPACRRHDAINAMLLEYERANLDRSPIPPRTVEAARGAADTPLPPEIEDFLLSSEKAFLGTD